MPVQKASADEPPSECAISCPRSAATKKGCWGKKLATYWQDCDEDGRIERDHQRYEAETEHDKPLVLGGRPCSCRPEVSERVNGALRLVATYTHRQHLRCVQLQLQLPRQSRAAGSLILE